MKIHDFQLKSGDLPKIQRKYTKISEHRFHQSCSGSFLEHSGRFWSSKNVISDVFLTLFDLFGRKNRIATILCVHHHFPDFRKPSRNIVQIGAEFERKMADMLRKKNDISVHKEGGDPERFYGNSLAAMEGTGPMGNAIV